MTRKRVSLLTALEERGEEGDSHTPSEHRSHPGPRMGLASSQGQRLVGSECRGSVCLCALAAQVRRREQRVEVTHLSWPTFESVSECVCVSPCTVRLLQVTQTGGGKRTVRLSLLLPETSIGRPVAPDPRSAE